MTKEDVEKASIHAIRKHYGCTGKYPCSDLGNCRFCSGKNSAYDCNECGADEFNEGFIIGANWRINSVWHDVKEMPENNRMILIIMKHDIPTVLGPDNTFFREEIKDRYIQRWAYIEDLIPNMEDKA